MKKINIDGLLALNLEEIQIVYRRLRGDSVRKVALDMNIPESTVWNQRIPQICEMLCVSEWREIEEQLKIPLRSIITSIEALERGWPEEYREKIEALRKSEEPQKQSSSTAEQILTDDSSQTTQEQRGRRRLPPWPVIAVPLFVISLLCLAGVVFAWSRLPNFFENEYTITPAISQSPETIFETTSTVEPSPSIKPTNTLLPTDTLAPTSTFTPMVSLTPTETIMPSPSPTATLPPLFATSFDKGLPSGMQMIYGDIDFVNGELVAHDFSLLAIGDDTWKNYQIEYDVRKHTYCWGLQNNGIAAHAIDQDNMIMFSWNYCETGWFEIVNGEWNTITSGRDIIANPGTEVTIRLVAKDGNFDLYINNRKDSSYYSDKYLQGKAYILVSDSSVIDNVRVSQLP